MNTSSGTQYDPRRDREPRDADGSLSAFAVVWATATMVHMLSFHFWARHWQGWMLLLWASLVLLRPESPTRFLAMVAASFANLFRSLPFVPNHILFEGIVNLTILVAAVPVVWRGRERISSSVAERGLVVPALALFAYLVVLVRYSAIPDTCGAATAAMIVFLGRRPAPERDLEPAARDLYGRFSGVLRWEFAAMYWWAVVQKLNHDYFDPRLGCAILLQHQIEARLGLPPSPEWTGPLLAWGSLLVEGSIPILLLVRRTRVAGFALAIVFHLWLALVPHPGVYSYSALVLGMLFVFLPPEAITRLRAIWMRLRERIGGPRELVPGVVIGSFYVLGITASLLYAARGHDAPTFHLVNTMGLFAFLVWGVWLSACYLRCWWPGRAGPEAGFSTNRLPAAGWTPAWLGLLLVLFNGACPWIGAKTQTSFSMFSNLRTEFEPNHMFLRRVDLFPYQRDMIEVVDSEPDLFVPAGELRSVEHLANPGRILPYFELRRLLVRHSGDVRVTIRRGGRIEVVQRVGGEATPAEAFAPISPVEEKLLWFRRHVRWNGAMPCTH